jgi:hypothetical protein
MAQGTAVAALEASSLMCTLESNEAENARNQQLFVDGNTTGLTDGPQWGEEAQYKCIAVWPSVHWNKRVKSKDSYASKMPNLQFTNSPRAKWAVFLNSEGVAIGSAMITAKQRLYSLPKHVILPKAT